MDPGPKKFHTKNVERLTTDILSAHKNVALHAKQSSNCRRGNSMLTGTGFSYHLLLAHATGQQDLPYSVINLVCTSVVQVFTLEVNLCTAKMLSQSAGKIKRAGTTHIIFKIGLKFGLE